MNRLGTLLSVTALVTAFAPVLGSAQTIDVDRHDSLDRTVVEWSAEQQAISSGPTLLAPRISSIDLAKDAILSESMAPQVRDKTGVPFMVGGGVLFVAGALAGGDAGTLLMVGGGVVGAFGAYKYFGGETN